MKKIGKIILLLMVLCLFFAGCSGETEGSEQDVVTSAHTELTVHEDGSCEVLITMQLKLNGTRKLTIPLPAEAKEVRLGGSRKTPIASGERMILHLPKMAAGTHTVELRFELDNAVTESSGIRNFSAPLLTGIALPIESYAFRVTMPHSLTDQPSFTSYIGDTTATLLDVQVSGNVITGTANTRLNDNLDLTVEYRDEGEMFPKFSDDGSFLGGWKTLMFVFMAASLVYYLLALLPNFPKKIRTYSPPEGLTAGDVATCMTGCGMDLTMMVFSWAQMGYLTIIVDRRGRVLLQKRMDMGSERSDYENYAFRKLFGGRDLVDGGGMHYAMLYRKMAKKSPLAHRIYAARSGNPQIVRIFAVAAGACGGILLSRNVYTAGAGTVLLALGLAVVFGILSKVIQNGGRCLPMGNRSALWIGLAGAVGWLLLGWLMGDPLLALALIGYETLVGIAAAVGGRRSETGCYYLGQIRGLRAHMTRGSVFDIQQCLERNPAYFFDMMPYALALGVEKRFARRFGKVRLNECAYIITAERENMTTLQWAALLRQVADCLNRRQSRLQFEHLLQRLPNHR